MRQPGWEEGLGENGYVYMYGWVPSLFTWNYYNIVNQLLEKEMATHSGIHAWKIPWTEEPGRLQSMGLQRVGHDWVTSLSLFFLLGKSGILRQTTNTDYHPSSRSGKLILHYILFKQVYVTEKVREGSWKGLLYLLVSNLSSFLKRASSKNFCLHCRFLAG